VKAGIYGTQTHHHQRPINQAKFTTRFLCREGQPYINGRSTHRCTTQAAATGPKTANGNHNNAKTRTSPCANGPTIIAAARCTGSFTKYNG